MTRWLIILLFATACRTTENSNPLLNEAAAFHNEAMAVAARLEVRLDSLEQVDTLVPSDTLRSIRFEIEVWESGVIEIPGYEHEVDHGKGHHHDHQTTPVNLTPEQMKEVQWTLLKRIQEMEIRLNQQLKTHESF